ncbi:MAG: hypothetical protein COB85_08450 [Bacteroidetes bacterium]|nr:MAG: hypothetical protein COB85_08450 [Bacteroidota bacterium]
MKGILKYSSILLIASIVISTEYSLAQDPQFSQFYSAPLYLNPAFTGNTIQGRAGANYRKQWPGVTDTYTSYTFFYDHNLSSINSGVGILLVRDKAGSAGLRYVKVGGLYSYKMAVTRKFFVNAGVRASYSNYTMDFPKLIFGDQLLRDDPNSVEIFEKRSISYFDMAVGIIGYGSDFWFGIAVDHLTTPNYSFMGYDADLPMKYSLHGGYIIPVKKTEKGEVTRSVTIAANYKAQGEWDQFDIGAYYKLRAYMVGVWYRGIPLFKAYKDGYSNNDAIILSVGYKVQDYLSVGYSYDITISKLGLVSHGAHEISIIYEYSRAEYKKDAKRRKFMVPCAKFTKMPYAITPAKRKKNPKGAK